MASASLRFSSQLAAPAGEVWATVFTMRGVNAELMPLIRMSYPAEADTRSLESAPTGELLFHSYLLLFGERPSVVQWQVC